MNSSNVSKRELVTKLLAIANRKKDEMSKSAKEAQERANEAEGAMQSRYDTFKEEGQYLAAGLKIRLEEIKSDINQIKNILRSNCFETKNKIGILSIVTVEFDDNSISTFFIFPVLSGEKIDEITVISPLSPIGSALMNKEIDDEIEVEVGPNKRMGVITYVA